MKFSDPSASGGHRPAMALQIHLDQTAENLAAMPVVLETLDEGADLVRSISRVERALEGAKMQVARQIDD